MDFQTLSRRQLQALCKKNKIPANLTNLAMADSLTALPFVEGIEEILNSDIAQSPMVPPTGGRSRAVKAVGAMETPGVAPTTATRRRAAASTSVRRMINESLDETEEEKRDIPVKTPAAAPASRRRVLRETSTVNHAYSTRRSARLAEKIEEPKERSEAIKMNSFTEEIDENVEAEMEGASVDQSQTSEITVVDNIEKCSEDGLKSTDEFEAISEETSDNHNGGDVAVATIEQTIEQEDEHVNALMEVSEKVCEVENEGSIDDTETNSNANGEVKASFEVTAMISNVKEEAFEKETEMTSNMDEEPKAAFEDSEMKTNMEEETKAAFKDSEMNSNMEEEPKPSIEGTEMKTNVDEMKTIDEATDMNSKAVEEIDIAEFEGNMEIQEAANEESSENETSDEEESDMSDDDCQKEMFVPEVEQRKAEAVDDAKHNDEALKNGMSKTPMKNVGKLVQISDGKENAESGRKLVVVKDAEKKQLEDYSMRQLTKMIKELEISKKQKNEGEDMMMKKATTTTTRPALKTLSENSNMMD